MKIGVFEKSYVDTVSAEYIAPDLYFVSGTHNNIQQGGGWRKMVIPCVVVYGLQLLRKHVSCNISYFYNEQHILCQV